MPSRTGFATTTAVCEIGPVAMRRLHPAPHDETFDVAAQLGTLLLASGDDRVLLAGTQPVGAAGCWRAVFADLFGDLVAAGEVSAVELIHPGWWPVTRVQTITDAARQVVAVVTTRSRREYVDDATGFVEIGSSYVAVNAPGALPVLEDRDAGFEEVLERVCARVAATAAPVCVDAPPGLAGAEELGAELAGRLRSAGRQVQVYGLAVASVVDQVAGGAPPSPRRGFAPVRVAAAVATTAVAVIVPFVLMWPAGGVEWLTEGAVTVEVPQGWAARRITGGPGSARVQVGPPEDPGSALHITQSRAAGGLEAAAQSLRTALSAQPPGVFSDFDPADRRQGRPAVTYREVRSDHVVEWTIVVDSGVRIGIGCQRAADGEERQFAACDRAVATARGLPS